MAAVEHRAACRNPSKERPSLNCHRMPSELRLSLVFWGMPVAVVAVLSVLLSAMIEALLDCGQGSRRCSKPKAQIILRRPRGLIIPKRPT